MNKDINISKEISLNAERYMFLKLARTNNKESNLTKKKTTKKIA